MTGKKKTGAKKGLAKYLGKFCNPTEPRRLPTQARSRETVDRILQAAVQVFERVGYDDTTTNHIAREGDLSVGSVYQYFPSKEAILLALWEQQVQADYLNASKQFAELEELPLEDFFAITLKSFLESFVHNTRLKLEIFRIVPRLVPNDKLTDVHKMFANLIQKHLEKHAAQIKVTDHAFAAFVLVNAITGNIQSLAATEPEKLGDPQLHRELVRMCMGYLCGEGPKGAAHA